MKWKDIQGFEGLYQVSDTGLVKSVRRHVANGSPIGMILPERTLKAERLKSGYLQVSLRKEGHTYAKYVHRLVATAFLDGCGECVNHIDGNKANCNVDNLELVSYRQNNKHAYDTGLHGKGEQHYRSKLTDKMVQEIRANGKCGTYEQIAAKYNVSKATVRDVLLHRTWAS